MDSGTAKRTEKKEGESSSMVHTIMKPKKKPMSRADVTYNVVFGIVFFLLALICFFPFYYLFICTISDPQLVEVGQITLLPRGLTFKNYQEVLKVQNLGTSAWVTVLRAAVGTLSSTICSAYLAYFFTKENMWGRKFWYRLVVATMYFSAGMIPNYLNNRSLGLLNSFWVYIVPGLVGVYNMILIKTSMESLPAELEESAVLDGAGYMTRLFRIVLPLSKPILATVALFSMVNHWNDFFTTQLYITNPKLYTLQFLLYEFLQQVTNQSSNLNEMHEGMSSVINTVRPTSIRLTLTAVIMIPIMCVYPFVQRFYVKGIMIGAVKG